MDFANPTTRGRLSRAIKSSYEDLRPFRSLTRELIKEYAGPGYGGEDDRSREMYANLLNQAVDAYQIVLAPNRPRTKITTEHRDLQAFAKHFETALNNLIVEIGLDQTVKRWVMDAFFCVGIVKVHMAESHLVQIEQDVWMDPGVPFASNISLDNWVHDASARRLSEAQFCGDQYRIPFEDLVQGVKDGQYDYEAAKEIQPSTKYFNTEDRIDEISAGYQVDHDELEPMVDLCDIYIRRTGKIYTFHVSDRYYFRIDGPPLAEMEWTGSEHGPYKMLGFNEVPENVMPVSSADQLSPLNRLIQNVIRKQSRQARRQKDVHIYSTLGSDSANKIKNASDGQWIRVTEPSEVRTIKQGGVDPGNQIFVGNAIDLFDRMGGNIRAMLGLGSQAETLGQEELIHRASSRKESHMQNKVFDALRDLMRDLGMMLWDDRFKTIPATMNISGEEIDDTWTPEDREGNFLDYNFEIDIYSMVHQTPGQRLQGVINALDRVFLPLLPMIQQDGGTIDTAELTDLYAEMSNQPRIKNIIKFDRPIQDQQMPNPQNALPGKQQGNREYLHRSIGGSDDGNSLSGQALAREWQQLSRNGDGASLMASA